MIPEIMGSNMRSREAIQLGESDVRNLHDVISQARPAAVVLMHLSFQTDVDALPRIIDNLRGRGLI